MRKFLFCMVLLFSAPALAAGQSWQVLPNESTIAFTAQYAGTAIKGQFGKFSADIAFDPNALSESRVVAQIEIPTLNSFNDERNRTLMGDAWFDVKNFPLAIFTGAKFTKISDRKYRIDGELDMRGIKQPFGFDFEFTEFGANPMDSGNDRAVAVASFPLNRLDFGIGNGQWANESQIANAVMVTIKIAAVRVSSK